MKNDKSYATASNNHINRFKMAHSIGVAEYMRERAKDYGLDPDTMYVLGLLHDIGYLGGREGHEKRGADLLDSMGLDYSCYFAIKYHGKNLYALEKQCGRDRILPELVLTIEADMSVDARGYRVGFDGRLADIIRRYGEGSDAHKTVQDNFRFIKEYQKEHGIGRPTALYHTDKQKGQEDR